MMPSYSSLIRISLATPSFMADLTLMGFQVCGPPGMMKHVSGEKAKDWTQGEVRSSEKTRSRLIFLHLFVEFFSLSLISSLMSLPLAYCSSLDCLRKLDTPNRWSTSFDGHEFLSTFPFGERFPRPVFCFPNGEFSSLFLTIQTSLT